MRRVWRNILVPALPGPVAPPPPPDPGLWPSPPAWLNLPTGLTFNSQTGRFTGTNLTTSFVAPALEETFTDTGNPATNMTNLQSTLDGWAAADVRKRLLIPAGTQFHGSLRLPANFGFGWVDLRVVGYTTPAGPPSASAGLFIIESQTTEAAVYSTRTAGVTTTHGRYAFHGAEIRFTSSLATAPGTGPARIVHLGNTNSGGGTQDALTKVPDGFYFEGCWIHGWSNKHCLRGVEWHCSNLHMYRTRVEEIHNKGIGQAGGDSQCVWGWNGPGPLFLDECVLSGADECFGTGGAVPLIANNVPSDLWLRRCRTDKPASMEGVWVCKNHCEWKFAKRVLLEECLHTGFPSYYDNQQQTVYGLKVSSENGSFAAAVFEDFLSYNCMADRVPSMNYLAKDGPLNTAPTRMAIINFVGINMNEAPDDAPINGIFLAWNSGSPTKVYYDHITVVTTTGEQAAGAMRMFGTTLTDFTMTNCLVECNGTAPGGVGGMWGSEGQGSAVITAKMAGTVVMDAVHWIGSGSVATQPQQLTGYPTGVKGYSNYASVGFTNPAGDDYSLTPGSGSKGAATDGFDVGVHDWAAHQARVTTVPS